MSTDHISNPELLFQLSELCDRLRDAAELLFTTPGSTRATTMLITSYNQLRKDIPTTLDEEAALFVDRYTTQLEPSDDIFAVYIAASQLAASVDTFMAVPAMVLRRRITNTHFDQLNLRLDDGDTPPGETNPLAELLAQATLSKGSESNTNGAYL